MKNKVMRYWTMKPIDYPWIVAMLAFVFAFSLNLHAQVSSPTDVFGFEPGADYKLANYEQMRDYYNKLDGASERVKKIEIGKTVDGRPMLLLFISSKENLQKLERWKTISEKLSRARIDNSQALKLSQEGKAIVWIDGGMHANELAHGQMTPELAYKIATEETEEMQHIRDNVILLLMPVLNPDGMDIVSDWYKNNLGTPYETSQTPWLYHRIGGHDNNRDWFMGNMPETKNVMEVLYRQWYPQIVHNHHQTGPDWTRIFVPPYNDPVNQKINPGVTAGVNEVGSAMMRRFAVKRMPGAVSREGASYTMFWNGGGRTVPFYHNQIGILTETSHRTPTPIYYDPAKKPERIGGVRTDSTSTFYPYPWQGGESHFRDAVDYMLTGSMAVLDYAADRRTNLLYDIYSMGKDAIEQGESGGPYAYVIPTQQWDSGEATNLANTLLRGGIEVTRATQDFAAGGKQYDAGSYVLYAGQPFRPYLMDLLEKQNYPNRVQYPGGPPDPPYDLTGWTLPMQMGVTVDRIDQTFDVQTNPVDTFIEANDGNINGNAGFGYLLDTRQNNSFKAVNTLLKEGITVYRAGKGVNNIEAGAFLIKKGNAAERTIKKLSKQQGLSFKEIAQKPNGPLNQLKHPLIGIYKTWIANMDEGWTRWLLQREYGFAVDSLHDADVIQNKLAQYHSIIIPSQQPSAILHGYSIREMPKEYTGGLGLEGTLALKKYVKEGGTLIAFDAASDFLIQQFGLPLKNIVQDLSDTEFFIPGSLIRTDIATDNPLGFGMQETVAVAFSRSRAFEIEKQSLKYEDGVIDIKDAPKAPVDVIARYADSKLLMSGWALGEDKYIAGKPAMVRIPYGKGQIVLFAFRPQFRGQPRGTYKLIFNALYGSTMDSFPISSE
jgi:hypothetical protein